MKKIVRLVYLSIIIGLLLFLSHLETWNCGYDAGYKSAMGAVMLKIDTPENFFTKLFDIRTPRRLEQRDEEVQ